MMILTLGTSSLIFMQACRPERLGIRTSRSTTSGTVATIRSVALIPSPASPTTSIPGSTPNSMVRPRRNSSWSSTTTTRTASTFVAAPSATICSLWQRNERLVHEVTTPRVVRSGHWSGPGLARSAHVERNHAVVITTPAIDHRGLLALLVDEQVEVVADELHLVERLLERHRCSRMALLAYDERAVACCCDRTDLPLGDVLLPRPVGDRRRRAG